MAILKVIYMPDERLRRVSSKIEVFDDKLQTLIDDMFDTMYHTRGVGLAAPQVGINIRLSVIDTSGDKSNQLVLINPEIIASEGTEDFQEGCLSVPGISDTVTRAKTVTMKALDRNGNPFEMTESGLLGECFQHEIDHLNGKLYIDLLSPLKRNLARKRFEKYMRQNDSK